MRDPSELGFERFKGDPVEVEPLAAADDSGEDFVRLGRCEKKLHIGRRLFEGLQEGVERLLSEHVHFVDDVDLIVAGGRGISDRLVDLADIVDPAVRGAIDFEDVERAACVDIEAGRAGVAWFAIRGEVVAIKRFGKDAGEGGLSRSAAAAEKIGVGQTSIPQTIF